MIEHQFFYNEKCVNMQLPEDGEHIGDHIRRGNTFYEIEFLEYIKTHYPKGNGIIDIGANIGNHSLFFKEFLMYDKIHCFEPHPKNWEILKENCRGLELYNTALSDKEEMLTMYNSENDNNGGFSFHKQPHSFVDSEGIETKTLDSYNLSGITLMKIDVEGWEERVLEGSRETIKRNRPVIFVENLGWGWPEMFDRDRLDPFFMSIGYKRKESNIVGKSGLGSLMDLWISE